MTIGDGDYSDDADINYEDLCKTSQEESITGLHLKNIHKINLFLTL